MSFLRTKPLKQGNRIKFTKAELDREIATTQECVDSGLSAADVLVGYTSAISEAVHDGTLSEEEASKISLDAAKYASVVTHYRETGELKQ